MAGHVGSFINCTSSEMARTHHVGSRLTPSYHGSGYASRLTRRVGGWGFWSLLRWNRMFFVLLLTARRRHEIMKFIKLLMLDHCNEIIDTISSLTSKTMITNCWTYFSLFNRISDNYLQLIYFRYYKI